MNTLILIVQKTKNVSLVTFPVQIRAESFLMRMMGNFFISNLMVGREKTKPKKSPLQQTTVSPIINLEASSCIFHIEGVEIPKDNKSWPKDNKIKKWLFKKKQIENFSWGQSFILGCETDSNPFYDPAAVTLAENNNLKENIILKFYSEKCASLVINEFEEQPVSVNYERPIIFYSEIDPENPEKPNEELEFSIPDSYFYQRKPFLEPFHDVYRSMPTLHSKHYFALELLEFNVNGDDYVEPILLNAILFNAEKAVSEVWCFCPEQSKSFFTDNQLPCEFLSKCVFELEKSIKNPLIIITCSRPLMVKSGEIINKYYAEPSVQACRDAKKTCKSIISKSFRCFYEFCLGRNSNYRRSD